MLTVNNVKEITRRLSGIMRSATIGNAAGVPVFQNLGDVSALNDLSIVASAVTSNVPVQYDIYISAEGTPDSIRYTKDGGTTWANAATITGANQTVGDLTVKFDATTGHTLGTSWSVHVSPGFSAQRLKTYVAALNDIDVLYRLVPSVYALTTGLDVTIARYTGATKAVASALAVQLGTSLDAYLTTNSLLVNAEFADYEIAKISPRNIIPAKTVLGVFEYSGAGAGTYTPVNVIDTTKYGAGKIEVFALSSVSVSSGIAGLSGVDFGGSAVTHADANAFGSALAQYAIFDASAVYTERFKSISSLTASGGAAGEKFVVRTKEDWAPLL